LRKIAWREFESCGSIMATFETMFPFRHARGMFVAEMCKARRGLESGKLFFRYQLNIALRRAPALAAP
jgi:hypothetical protein